DAKRLEVLRRAKSLNEETVVIVMTAYGTVDHAVEAMREGAFDYLAKPFAADELMVTIDRAVRHRKLILENRDLRNQVSEELRSPEIVGSSPELQRLLEHARKVAPTEANVLITGPSGTGKGLFAEFLHAHSKRSEKPFVAVDCAAIPETLLESELFGHERGAFTGAVARKHGLLEQANRGTVFLDEIAEMTPALQSKLLRAIEERVIRRVGGNESIPIDVRIIAATNMDLQAAVRDGRFREDLFFRLNVIPLEIPPLRERRGDIALLTDRFVAEYSARLGKDPPRISPEAWAALEAYAWPGNIRELRNLAERLVILCENGQIQLADLPQDLRPGYSLTTGADDSVAKEYDTARAEALQDFQRRYLAQLLTQTRGNVSEAARIANVSRRTVHRWLEEVGETARGIIRES
ncbi:MAG: sigma-54-dependent transcriptional regulator, partial [Gemmatimonadales bacterium]